MDKSIKSNKEIFNEIDKHLLDDKNPSEYFQSKEVLGYFKNMYPFSLAGELIKTEQSPKHHPEGSAWNHTMLVVDNAACLRHESNNPRVFMWAALLHDIGKGPATRVRKGRITSYDHDKVGAKLSMVFLNELTDDQLFAEQVSKLVRWHMQLLFVTNNLPFADIKTMVNEVPIHEISLLCMCDRLGRGDLTKDELEKVQININNFIKKSLAYRDFE